MEKDDISQIIKYIKSILRQSLQINLCLQIEKEVQKNLNLLRIVNTIELKTSNH